MSFFQKKYLPEISLLVLAIGLYANTLHHGFVLDDQIVLTQNSFVKKGIAGIPDLFSHDTFAGYDRLAGQENSLPGGRYRPFSLAVFAVLYSIFGANAVVFHALAILLYALTGLLLYGLLRKILDKDRSMAPLAWAVAALFLAHPVHTEVVANVKSCDEQLALLFGLGACWLVFKGYDSQKKRDLLLAGILFFLACLSKENAVLLGILTPLALWLFRDTSVPKALKQALSLLAALAVFLLIRSMATSSAPGSVAMSADPLNNSFLVWNGSGWLPCSFSARAASILFSLGYQLRLLVFPYPLTHDYYHFPLRSFSDASVWASAMLLVLALGYGLLAVRQRWKGTASLEHAQLARYGVLFMLMTMGLTSNILFPVGAVLAERFLYLPSVGFCLALVTWGAMLCQRYFPALLAPGLGFLIAGFSLLTLLRNPAWESNERLLRTDVAISTESPKLNNDYGTALVEKGMKETDAKARQRLFEEAYPYLEKALKQHPTYYDAFLAHGACAYYLGKFEAAVASYRRAHELYPQDPKSTLGLKYSLQAAADDWGKKGNTDTAITTMTEAWQLQPDTLSATHLSFFFQQKNDQKAAAEWLQKALDLAPNDGRLLKYSQKK
jgi:Tfp pilus assembly protein PilF